MMDDELKKLLAEYHGVVKRCEPGEARGKRVKPVPVLTDRPVDVRHERAALKDDEAGRWLAEHDPVAIAVERRRVRHEQRRERWRKQQRCKEIPSVSPPLWAVLRGPPEPTIMQAVTVSQVEIHRVFSGLGGGEIRR